MRSKQAISAGLAMIAAALVYSAVLYPHLPPQIPVHWNFRGEPDGWMAKSTAVLVMPGMMALLLALTIVLPRISPRNFRIEPFAGTFNYLMVAIAALMGFEHVCMMQAALHPALDMGRIMFAGLFLFVALIGNVMGKVRRNFWIGIRTPWTLASDHVWIATHRLAGRLFVATGILGAAALIAGANIGLCMAAFLAAIFVPCVYSYFIYRANED